jgi:hypothetical protein
LRTALPLTLLLALPACGDPLGNGVFAEDRLYLEAMPERSQLRVEHPGNAPGAGTGARDLGEPAALALSTAQVAWSVNSGVHGLLARVESVARSPVVERGDGFRRWGRVALPDGDGEVWLEVERTAERAFTFDVLLDRGFGDGEAIAVMTGTWRRDGEAREGEGSFLLDATALGGALPVLAEAGSATCTFQRGGAALTLDLDLLGWTVDQGPPRDSSYHFVRSADGGGRFAYSAQGEVFGDDDRDEDLTVEAAWTPDRSGRADAWLSGGSVDGSEIPASECWDTNIRRTFWRMDAGGPWAQEEGDEENCVLPAADGAGAR